MEDNRRVSIIISTYSKDRYDDLIDLLGRINSQTYDNMETIIIVDNNKALYDIIVGNIVKNKMFERLDIRVVINTKNVGLSYNRNIGINNSTGDIIAFIDDDAIPDYRWIENIVRTFNINYKEIGAISGYMSPLWRENDNSMHWFPKELFWMVGCSYVMTPDHQCEVERGFGSNMAIKKDTFDKVGLFNEELGVKGNKWVGGEDTDMYLRIKNSGMKIMFTPDAIVFHKIHKSKIGIINLIKRAFNGGFSVAMMKSICKYEIKISTENDYFKKLLFEFYPSKIKNLIIRPSKLVSKQLFTVSVVILSEGLGYLWYKFSR